MANIYPEAILNFKKGSLSFVGGILGFSLNYHTLRSHLEKNSQASNTSLYNTWILHSQYFSGEKTWTFLAKEKEMVERIETQRRERKDTVKIQCHGCDRE